MKNSNKELEIILDYNFKNINIVSAGERDPDADGAEGMSASKMRAAAVSDDFDSFKQGVVDQKLANVQIVKTGERVTFSQPHEVADLIDYFSDDVEKSIKNLLS